MPRPARSAILALLLVVGGSAPVFADITAFLGTAATPSNRAARGFAFGVRMVIVGFEFEYSDTSEEPVEAAPSLRTGMGNVLLETPVPIFGVTPYITTGGGFYREGLGALSETGFAVNTGGGVKVSLLGPVRTRLDYRVFKLRGEPMHETVHRFYAGLNLSF